MAADRTDADARARVPFWAHQIAELLLGVVLLFEGARTGTHFAVMIAGAALILFALVTEGPLGAWPVLSRRAHRVGDVVLALVLAASPFLLGIDATIAVVLLELAAVALLWMAWRSDFRARVPRRRSRGRAADTAQASGPTASSQVSGPSVPSVRDAGRALGRLRGGGVRAVGRAVGRASAERATEQQASAERATEQQASAERATEQQASAERGTEQDGREGDGGDDSSRE